MMYRLVINVKDIYIYIYSLCNIILEIISFNLSEQVVQVCQKLSNIKYELIGSWAVRVGDLDQYVHLWKHQGGYAAIDKTNYILEHNKVS